ncbi:MAG: tetraacyldisaccharide 4'-kinase [Burkholderiaceae bacterium]
MKARIEQALHAAWRKNGLLSLLLWPLSCLYASVAARRRNAFMRHPERVHHDTVPVVVVGNIYVGGTGKTPVVIALIQALKERGWQPGVVSRGYGAQLGDKPRTGQGRLDADLFGDEPALIAAATGVPVAVHPDRKAAILRLRKQYPSIDVVVSDDGLQHLALGRDLEIIVQDARGVGNGLLLPAGPLRESPDRLQSADFIVNNLQPGETAPLSRHLGAYTVDMRLVPARVEHLDSGAILNWKDWLAGHKKSDCAAVAAIGRPERFFSMLRNHGLSILQTRALPDHYDYRQSPFQGMDAQCILITPKDAVKCGKFNEPRLYCVHPAQRFSKPEWLDLVHERLNALSKRKHAAALQETDVYSRQP